MEVIEFRVRGSTGSEYTVIFKSNGVAISASCSCQAGHNRDICKHRVALLSADFTHLVNSDIQKIERIGLLLKGTALETSFEQFCSSEATFDEAKKQFAAAKKDLAKVMNQ